MLTLLSFFFLTFCQVDPHLLSVHLVLKTVTTFSCVIKPNLKHDGVLVFPGLHVVET